MASPPRVVIVGGGQAGAGVAQALAGIADVTLVDP
jgi:NADH dehydrogenase FAD-containing subunit